VRVSQLWRDVAALGSSDTMAASTRVTAMAVYTVEITTAEGPQSRTVHAFSVTTEPGWLLFWDHDSNIVARFKEDLVISVWRGDTIPGSDEDRIRDAMAGAQDHPGRIITR